MIDDVVQFRFGGAAAESEGAGQVFPVSQSAGVGRKGRGR
jgi:hypothetical protein